MAEEFLHGSGVVSIPGPETCERDPQAIMGIFDGYLLSDKSKMPSRAVLRQYGVSGFSVLSMRIPWHWESYHPWGILTSRSDPDDSGVHA